MPQPRRISPARKSPVRFFLAGALIVGVVSWLAISGARDTKSYYVTITELQAMGDKAHHVNLRVAGNVQPGTITRSGPNAEFTLIEQGKTLRVDYEGAEPPPDTFKDDAQALAIGTYGRDGVFHATQLQAKCASKYAPAATSATTTTASAAPVPK